LHVDGFLDTCDGLFAEVSRERRLEIMRDPHHGTFAVVGMVMLAAFGLAALAAIPPIRFPVALAFSCAAARLAVLPNVWIFAYPSDGSMGRMLGARPNVPICVLSLLFVCALGWTLSPWAVAIVPGTIGVALLGGWFANRRLGGLTGDVYGAQIAVGEVIAILAITAILR
jgi:adenosylcobinamide-GDP ribazoletransferase